MGGRVVALAVQLTFRTLAVALGIAVTYAAAELGPAGLVVLAVFLLRGRRPLAQALARIQQRTVPSQV